MVSPATTSTTQNLNLRLPSPRRRSKARVIRFGPTANLSKDRLARQLDRQTMNPLHEFPNELLARIFRIGATTTLEQWKIAPFATVIPLPLPMVVCAVCQHWRQVALNSPDLWSSICIPFFFSALHPRRLLHDAAKFTSIWLARSKEAPLDIYLAVPNIPLAYDLSVDVLLPKILQQTHRLRTLVLLGDTGGMPFANVRGILALISTKLINGKAQVHALSLGFQARGPTRLTVNQARLDRDWEFSPTNPPSIMTSSLSVEGLRFSPSFFPHLVSLTIARLEVTVAELRDAFAVLPSLRRLSLPQVHVLLEPVRNTDSITVPSISYLFLSFHRRPLNSTSPYPIAYLRLPNLRTLELDGKANVPISSCFDTPFISSLSSLNSLTLRNFVRFSLDSASDTTWDDIRLLHNLSTITQLRLIETPTGDKLLHPYSPPPSSRPRRPSLGRIPRADVSPQITEMSRTLEGMLQKLRVNARHEQPLDDMASSAHAASSSRDAQINWPILETICIDSILAADLVSVCEYISSNSNVKTVCLSGPARRHLFNSVKRRLSTNTFFYTNFYTRRNEWDALKAKDGGNDSNNVESGGEWLKERAQVIRFEEFDICAPDLGLYVPL